MAKAFAKAIIEVEVEFTQGWGGECTVSQVVKQAHHDAVAACQKLLNAQNECAPLNRVKISRIHVDGVSVTYRDKEVTNVK